MKKLLLFLSLIILSVSVKAQYIKSGQIMYYQNQSDLAGVVAEDGQLAYCVAVKFTFRYNAVTGVWEPLERVIVKKSTVNINGKTIGATKIYTMEPSTLKFYPTMIIIRAISISGVTTSATVSIGTNSTAYNNISSASLLSTLLSTLGATGGSPQLASASYPIAGSTDIYANVSIGAIATNYTFNIEIIGFYDNN